MITCMKSEIYQVGINTYTFLNPLETGICFNSILFIRYITTVNNEDTYLQEDLEEMFPLCYIPSDLTGLKL